MSVFIGGRVTFALVFVSSLGWSGQLLRVFTVTLSWRSSAVVRDGT